MREPWYESENPTTVARGLSWRAAVWIVTVVAFVALIGIGSWAFRVATSDVKGRGDAVVQKNSAKNRIAAQARFEELYAEITSTDRKLLPAQERADADPKSTIARTEFTGLVNYCLDVVADYNAEARKYLAGDFRAMDLPAVIDGTAPETDCKP